MHMPDVSSNDIVQPLLSNHVETKGMGWLLPLLLLVLTGALVFYFVKGSTASSLPIAQQFIEAIDTSSNNITTQKNNLPVDDAMEIRLPNNSFVRGEKDGIEHHLVEYLNNQKDTINKNRWFNFNAISFENDNVTLAASSKNQIENIVSILKAYPKLKIKIGAFTDKTNDEAADLKLTEQQANAVDAALKKAGANTAQLINAEGYGSKYAKSSVNASIKERMKDRKISVNVEEK